MTALGLGGAVLAGVLAILLLASVVAIGYVLNRDAAARGMGGLARTFLTAAAIFVPFLVVPVYAVFTRWIGARRKPASRTELLLAWGALTVVVAVIAGTILSPPDPVSQLLYVGGFAVVFGLVGLVPLIRRGVFEDE
ncbi:hypothetical protein [Halorubrum vacuolatum]|uniref:Uncharacterized protein n=1 Tax=Halorubrum vacuolatum TaxID=63740 RepID=A0A238UV72_HALVU|nr:hypothetical protein [Halorubrum vacuolatum]SNR26082.1 hypothetical protein SAMN06264855_101442 [Halorubrum vacuolatum]